MTLLKILALIILPGLALALAWLVRDVIRRRNGSGLIALGGLLLMFMGERVFPEGEFRLPVSGLGLLVVLVSLALRVYAIQASEGARRSAHVKALFGGALVVAGLALYALTLDPVVSSLGLDEEAASRWNGAWSSIFPIVVALGIAPTLMLDRVIAIHPVELPAGAAMLAVYGGLNAALAIALLFPVNYLASTHDEEWDVAYFRTTKPGTSTLALVGTLAEPVSATLFFTSANEVRQEIEPYFRELEGASNGRLTLKVVDQALDPKVAEELKVRENGYVALTRGEVTEKFKVGTEMNRAKRELKKLDGLVQQHLMKLTRGQRTVYTLAGHAEASAQEKDDPLRKLSLLKRQVLEAQNLKVQDFGVGDGSTNLIPEDAGLVIIAAPQNPLLPEEEKVLQEYWNNGGRLLVLLDPESDPLTGLLNHLGVERGSGVLAHAEEFVRQNRGPADRVFLVSNKFGSHESVQTLARNSSQLFVIMPTTVAVSKSAETSSKVTTLIRSFPDTFVDANDNRQADPDEEKSVFEMAVAVNPAEGEARAIVVGDVSLMSDPVLAYSKGNAIFAIDGIRWLLGDEELAGEISSEEDVKIVHTREEDQYWFWATTGAVPLMVLGLGVVFVQIRRRAS